MGTITVKDNPNAGICLKCGCKLPNITFSMDGEDIQPQCHCYHLTNKPEYMAFKQYMGVLMTSEHQQVTVVYLDGIPLLKVPCSTCSDTGQMLCIGIHEAELEWIKNKHDVTIENKTSKAGAA